jgi:hypothetical protein
MATWRGAPAPSAARRAGWPDPETTLAAAGAPVGATRKVLSAAGLVPRPRGSPASRPAPANRPEPSISYSSTGGSEAAAAARLRCAPASVSSPPGAGRIPTSGGLPACLIACSRAALLRPSRHPALQGSEHSCCPRIGGALLERGRGGARFPALPQAWVSQIAWCRRAGLRGQPARVTPPGGVTQNLIHRRNCLRFSQAVVPGMHHAISTTFLPRRGRRSSAQRAGAAGHRRRTSSPAGLSCERAPESPRNCAPSRRGVTE